MKKILLIVAALFVAVSFSSCDKDEDKDASIVGYWQLVWDEGYSIYNGNRTEWDDNKTSDNYFLNLNSDGYGTTNYDGDGQIKYKFIIGKLFLTYMDHGNDEAVWNVAKLTSSELVLEWQIKETNNERMIRLTFIRK